MDVQDIRSQLKPIQIQVKLFALKKHYVKVMDTQINMAPDTFVLFIRLKMTSYISKNNNICSLN